MLSRRSVRVKVMQALYALNSDQELTFQQAEKSYWKAIDRTYDLLIFNLFTLIEITKVAVKDGKKKKNKHLPSDYDKKFSPKLYLNPIIQAMVAHNGLKRKIDKYGFKDQLDQDYLNKMYSKFSKTDEYKAYILDDEASHLDILLEMYRFCRSDDFFNEIMEDSFFNWQDDKSLVIGSVKKCFKAAPDLGSSFFEDFYPDHETIDDYGKVLMVRTHEDEDVLIKMIKPLLKNWDHERLAMVDLLLLKMGVVEFLNFETIPTKVTINEFVEVSKQYSTPKSKDFINGVLDKVLKDLIDGGKVVKKGRGLIE